MVLTTADELSAAGAFLEERLNSYLSHFQYFQALRDHPEPESINLRNTIKFVIDKRDERVNLELTEEPCCIYGPFAVSHLLKQPYLNARKFAENCTICLRERTVRSFDSPLREKIQHELGVSDLDSIVSYSVHDDGCGIAAEALPKIFDYDYSTSSDLPGGLRGGFGLGFVAEHISEFNGFCHVESRVGVGTDFYMFFRKSGSEKA